MLTSILGLGGGGLRVSVEYFKWLESLGAKAIDENDSTGWVFQGAPLPGAIGENRVQSAFGFALMDCVSYDIAAAENTIAADYADRPLLYTVASQEGFAGDYERAFNHIQNLQEDIQKRSSGQDIGNQKLDLRIFLNPSNPEEWDNGLGEVEVPLIDYMVNKLQLSESDAVLACTSLLGGTGRGVFEYINKNWEEIFGPDTLKLMMGVIPPIGEQQVSELRSRVALYLDRLSRLVKNKDISSVILADYSLARAMFNATQDLDSTVEYRKHRAELGPALSDKDKVLYESHMDSLSRLTAEAFRENRNNLDLDTTVDGGIVLATAPLFANAVGPLTSGDNRPVIRMPKLLDARDLLREVDGSFLVPCYIEARESPGPRLDERFSGLKNYYHALGVDDWILSDPMNASISMLGDMAIWSGSLLPLPEDRMEIGRQCSSAFYVAWASPGLDFRYESMNALSSFLRSTYGIRDARGYLLEGDDLIRSYTSDRFKSTASDVVFRLWVYLCLKDVDLAKDALAMVD